MLNFIRKQMEALNIPYELGEWTSDVIPDRYFIGEPTYEPTADEDGSYNNVMILTGTTRGKRIILDKDRRTIEKHFNPSCGLCAKTDGGSIAVFFKSAFYVPTGEADLNRIQINLDIKEWKG